MAKLLDAHSWKLNHTAVT